MVPVGRKDEKLIPYLIKTVIPIVYKPKGLTAAKAQMLSDRIVYHHHEKETRQLAPSGQSHC